MKLTAYVIDGHEIDLRPAPARRAWMDATIDSFAYRCLPLNIANAHGWEVLCPIGFSVRWNGGVELSALDIRPDDRPEKAPVSIFGHGILTFHVNALMRTEEGWNLWAGGPVNMPKDGIAPLAGVIETDWSPYSFTMNWQLTRADHTVRFEQGEPFCHLYPVRRGYLDAVEPTLRWISDEPEVAAAYHRWTAERHRFNDHLTVDGSDEQKERWKKRYYRGADMDDRDGAPDHQIRLRLRAFDDRRSGPAKPAAGGRPASPFRRLVPLGLQRHDGWGIAAPDYRFARHAQIVPLMRDELAAVAREHPLVFTLDPPDVCAVLGGVTGENLHVGPDGGWRRGAPVPSFLRQYPLSVQPGANERPTVHVDEECPWFGAGKDQALIAGGKLTPAGERMRALAVAFAEGRRGVREFVEAVRAAGLLVPNRLIAPPPIGQRSSLGDRPVIDPVRYRALPAATLDAWRARGWDALAEACMASQENWPRIIAIERERHGLDPASAPDVAHPGPVDPAPPPLPAAAGPSHVPLVGLARRPVTVSISGHAGIGVTAPDYRFAERLGLAQLGGSEMWRAAHDYPLVVTVDPPAVLAVLGARPDENRFVADGAWEKDRYIPAIVRQYPFLLRVEPGTGKLVLCIDEDCPWLDRAAPRKLIEAGGLTELGKAGAAVAEALARDVALARAFVAAAMEQGVLSLPPQVGAGRPDLAAALTVDPGRLAALPEAMRQQWAARGWTEMAAAIVRSADRWNGIQATATNIA